MNKKAILAGVMALMMGICTMGCNGGSGSKDTVAVQSVSMLAGLGTIGLQNRYPGVVVAQATHSVEKDPDRTIAELKVSEGDEVKIGQVLFTYDTDEIKLAIEQSELELEKMQNGIESTKQQIEKLKKEKAKAPASEQLSYSIEIQMQEANIKEDQYSLKLKKTESERLKKSLGNAEVVSECAGVIQSIKDDKDSSDYGDYGMSASGADANAYITIVEVGTYRVKGTVSETNFPDLGGREGSSVIIRSRVEKDRIWHGTLGGIDTENPQKDNNNGYYGATEESNNASKYPFYVELEESEGLLMGQHVFIELDMGQEDETEALMIAAYYVEQADSNPFVWAANDRDKLEKRKVVLGNYDEDTDCYEILEGLAPEDYIAIPSEELKEGLPVTRYDEEYFDQGDFAEDGDEEKVFDYDSYMATMDGNEEEYPEAYQDDREEDMSRYEFYGDEMDQEEPDMMEEWLEEGEWEEQQ